MALNASKIKSKSSGNVTKQDAIEAGTYPARIVQLIDLGLQPQRAWQGQEKDPVQEIMITYEMLDEFCLGEDGEELEDKPRWLSETIPFHSLDVDLAKSTKRYKALDPTLEYGGDFTELVGEACMVTVTVSEGKGKNVGKQYNNVANVAQMRAKEAKKAEELKNPPKIFIVEEPDMEVFSSLPDWLQDKIKSNLEFNGSALQEALGGKVSKPTEKPQEPDTTIEPEEDIPW